MQSLMVPGTTELDAAELARIRGGCEWVCDFAELLAKGVKALRRAGQSVKRGIERLVGAFNN